MYRWEYKKGRYLPTTQSIINIRREMKRHRGGFAHPYRKPRRGPRAYTRRTRTPAVVVIPGITRQSGYYGRFTQGGERKFHDVAVDDAVVKVGLEIFNLSIIPEGNGESERIGRKITITQISCNWSCELPAATAAGSTSDTVNVLIVQDRQTNGAQFAATDLKENDNIVSFNNLANSKRFKILYSRDYNLQAGGAAASGAAFVFSENRRFKRWSMKVNIPIEYDNSATSGVITSVRSNNLYFCTRSSTGLCATIGRVRLRYTDN